MEDPQQEGAGIIFKKPHEMWTEERRLRKPSLRSDLQKD
jgi:hypothetical protein